MIASPTWSDSAQYGELFGLVSTDADFVSSSEADPVDLAKALKSARRYQLAAADLVANYVRDYRASGATWREIGAALGVSLQAAQQLHARSLRDL